MSCDELTSILFDNDLGDKHDEISKRVKQFLLKKAVEIVSTGINVILDWGFWSKTDRDFINHYFKSKDVFCEWYYINIDDKSWKKNIDERNQRVLEGKGGGDYYLDEGLMKKLESKWEEPSKDEIDVWFNLER